MSITRRLLHALIIVLTLVVGATSAAIIVSQTVWFKDWLRGYLVREANQYLNGTLAIERLGGNLFFGIELEKIGISVDGTDVIAVQDVGLRYNVFQMIARGVSIDEIRLNHPVVYLTREGDTWSVARLIKEQEQEADREGPASPIAVDAIGITDASVIIDDPVGTSGVAVPKRVDHLDARLSFKYEPVRYSIDIDHLSFRTAAPSFGLNALSGGVSVRDDTVYVEKLALRTEESSVSIAGAVQHYLTNPIVNLEISSDKLSIPEIARVVPALAGLRLQPAFELKLDGPLDRLGVSMNVRSSAGQITGQLTADALAPGQSVKGDISVRHVDVAAFLPSQPHTDLSADLRADLAGETLTDMNRLTGDVSLRTGRLQGAGYTLDRLNVDASIEPGRVKLNANAQAYGIAATAAGRVVLPDAPGPGTPVGPAAPVVYDMSGALRHVDLRRLPKTLGAPAVGTNVNLTYRVRGSEPLPGSGSVHSRPVARRVTADARFDDSVLPGAQLAKGSTVQVVVEGAAVSYSADATVRDLDLKTVGEAFDIPALRDEKYRSTIDAHLQAKGRGTTLGDLNLQASGELTEAQILGGSIPKLAFTAAVADDTAHVTAQGAFARFDPAGLSGNDAVKGEVAGSVDVDATVTGLSSGVTADNVAGQARATLESSSIGGLAIEHAEADLSYSSRAGDIRTLEIVGRDLNVSANGAFAIDDTGESNLTVHVDTPRLQEIGALFNTPVAGIARVDATITGNRSELRADGTITGNGLKYNDNGALSITSRFAARVPDLAMDRAAVEADTAATFVTVAGQNVNELTAKTTYDNRQITFEATAEQPDRSLSAGGSVSLQPEQQELQLQRLGLQSRGVQLQLAPGAKAVVRYAGDAVSVEDLRLTSGDAEITVAGTFGHPGDALQVTVNHVDLATVDALLLREPQLSGRFDASATIAGTTGAPQVDGKISVSEGGFRQFRYDSLTGTLKYVPKGVTLDVRLQQNPSQWFTAKGYLPTALFSASAATTPAGDSPEEADQIDLTVDSSPIDLGVVQGFTTALTGVKGSAEAHVRVAGTAGDPRPEGRITIRDGQMKVEPTGGVYSHIAAAIQLQPDRLRIEQFTVLDNHDSALSVSGDVALDEKRVSGVQLYVTANDFKIVDNEMGNVRIQSNLELAGDLKAPRIGGYLGVTTGEINLDNVLAQVGTSPYPTEAVNLEAAVANDSAPDGPPPAGAYAASTIDVGLNVPNDLVVKASNLQTPGSPIGLGALIVTLGGDIRATKKPGDSIRLVGAITTVRGNYDFQGRRFEILRDGSIRFVGLEDMNPTLDLRTRRIIQGVEARVNIRGTLKQPEIELSSTPPQEPADILSLIVFNQPINQLGEGQQTSLAQRAQALATGAVAGQLAQSIGNALNLDTFEIQTAPESGGAAEVTLGQQLGERLFVRVQQGIGDQSTTNFILEYELTNWLRLQTNVMQGSSTQQSLFRRSQGSGADLLFFFSY